MNYLRTKLNKSYVVLATLIAVLGVIFALFFASNSYADQDAVDQESNDITVTFSGKAIYYGGDTVDDCSLNINITDLSDNVIYSGTTNTGEFTSNSITIPDNENPYYLYVQQSIHGDHDLVLVGSTFIDHHVIGVTEIAFPDCICSYSGKFEPYANGVECQWNQSNLCFENQYGYWTWEVPPFPPGPVPPLTVQTTVTYDCNNGGYPTDIYFDSATFDVLDNVVTCELSLYGSTKTNYYTFHANKGYTENGITASQYSTTINATSIQSNVKIDGKVKKIGGGLNISGVVTDATDMWSPVAGAFVQYCHLTPWGPVPVEGMNTFTDWFGHYTIEGVTEDMLPGVIRVYRWGYEVGESWDIWFVPEGMDTIYRPVLMTPAEPPVPPVPPTPPIPPDPPVPPVPPVPPTPPQPVPPTPVDPGTNVPQTGDSTAIALAIASFLALCGARGFTGSAKTRRKNK